jgi:hypothetical protein
VQAIRVLEAARPRSDGSRDLLIALASLHREAGNTAQSIAYVKLLAEINPGDPALAGLAGGDGRASTPAPGR